MTRPGEALDPLLDAERVLERAARARGAAGQRARSALLLTRAAQAVLAGAAMATDDAVDLERVAALAWEAGCRVEVTT